MTPTINVQKPPATPAIRFSFTAGPAGLLGANFTFVSPSGQQTISLDYYTTTAPTSGAVDKLQYPVVVNQYAEPGVYTLEEIDTTGNGTETGMYTGPALSSMASTLSFTVVNTGRPDTTPPVAAAARIVTGTVNLASARPVFLVDLTVADDLSGVAFTNITVTGPTGNTFVAGNDTSAPVVKSATLQIGGNLGGLGQPTGTYSVTEVDLTDVAGNTTTINDPAALSKLFGGAATFQVKD